jgi:hypothetical protein
MWMKKRWWITSSPVVKMSEEDKIILEDALTLVRLAAERGLFLRLLGAVGIRVNASRHEDLFNKLNRLNSERKFTDIDLAAYSCQRNEVRKLLEEVGYQVDRYALLLHGSSRMMFQHPEKKYCVDVFFDKLEFSHDVWFGSNPKEGRLNLNPLTLSPTDLLLEKLQIHEINEKDIKDIILLLAANTIGEEEGENIINGKYIATLLADDWGFWYDATLNLQKTLKFLEKYVQENMVDEKVQNIVSERISELQKLIERQPKTKNWEKRSKQGSKKKWWRDVEERSR